jgi:hypothetical protein
MVSKKLKSEHKTAPYFYYILIGFLYVIVKIIFVLLGYLHTGAIFHGLIPTVLTVIAGFLAFRESKRNTGSIWHLILVVLPILSFVLTPIYMYLKEQELWLTSGRLEVIIIYEVFACIQFVLAFAWCKGNR